LNELIIPKIYQEIFEKSFDGIKEKLNQKAEEL
jgi:hypothetical protein